MAAYHEAEKFFFNPRLKIGSTKSEDAGLSMDAHRSYTNSGNISYRDSDDTNKGLATIREADNMNTHDHDKSQKDKTSKDKNLFPQINPDKLSSGQNRALRKSESMDSIINFPPVLSKKKSRLYGSHPVLGQARKESKVSEKTNKGKDGIPKALASLPVGLDCVGTSPRKESLNKPDNEPLVSSLPSIISSQIKFPSNLLDDDTKSIGNGPKEGEQIKTSKDQQYREAEEQAQKEVDQDWVLSDQIKDMNKKFEHRKQRLTIILADEDPMVVIEKRLQEIKQMTKPKRDERKAVDKFPPEVRDLILKYKAMPLTEMKKQRPRHGSKYLDMFRRAVDLVRLLLRGFRHSKRYFVDQSDASQLRRRMETMVNHSSGVSMGRASIGWDLQMALSTQPQNRDKRMVKQIMWILRATKAVQHLFPAEMEEQVAKMIAYERYDDGRIIAYQGKTPDRFYYVMSGRVNLIRQYKLSTGQVTKSMGFLTKGMTTDPQELDMQWMREDSLVSKGQVEVLLIDKKSFSFLQHTTDGPPVDFLKSLDLFSEFPVERFHNTHDCIEVKYYGQGKIIVKDSNRTPWLLVVKSGFIKVVRRQTVIDAKLSNESKFTSPTIAHLGCGKSFSHADAMLGLQAKQRKTKASHDGLILPQDEECPENTFEQNPAQIIVEIESSNPFVDTLGIKSPPVYRHTPIHHPEEGYNGDINVMELNGIQEDYESSEERTEHEENTDFVPHSLWLTREKTKYDKTQNRRGRNEIQQRRAYLQLDVLKPGDVFGLDHMQPPVASEPMGVSLLSDGAEVVKISKRFFLQNADNNTMLKVETMYKEYLSEDDATQELYKKETWQQYKEALWARMTAVSPIPAAGNR